MPRGRRSTLLLSVAAIALPVALGACSTLGVENGAALTTPAPDGGVAEPVQEAAEVDAGRLLRIGAATEAVGDLENAVAMYQRALSLAPDSIEAQLALAEAYRRLGAPENAAKGYRSVLEREPANLLARRGLGNALIALGRPAEALAEFDLMIAAEPLDERGHNGRGVALSMLGHYEEARQAYESGLKLAPADLELNNNLATLLMMTGQPAQALAILKRIAAYPSAPERVRRNLARAEQAIAERGVDVSELGPPPNQASASNHDGVLYQAPATATQPQVVTAIRADAPPAQTELKSGAEDSAAAPDSPDVSIDEHLDDTEASGAVALEPSAGSDEPATPAAPDGPIAGYRVQLSAEPSRERALARWDALSAAQPDLLGAFSPHISMAPDIGNGTLYRLRTDPQLSQQEAQALCDALAGRSVPCYVSTVFKGPRPGNDATAKADDVAPRDIAPAQPERPAEPAAPNTL